MSESNAAIAGAVVGGIIAICGSVVFYFVTHRAEYRELKDRSLKDLIAELKQNKRYQLRNHYIDLEDSAYKRLREGGFFHTFSNDLQSDLQELYAFIHEKNGLIAYYNSVGAIGLAESKNLSANFLPPWNAAQSKALGDILGIIKSKEEKIASLIDKILPALRNLLRDPITSKETQSQSLAN